jgi:hypothetical protein
MVGGCLTERRAVGNLAAKKRSSSRCQKLWSTQGGTAAFLSLLALQGLGAKQRALRSQHGAARVAQQALNRAGCLGCAGMGSTLAPRGASKAAWGLPPRCVRCHGGVSSRGTYRHIIGISLGTYRHITGTHRHIIGTHMHPHASSPIPPRPCGCRTLRAGHRLFAIPPQISTMVHALSVPPWPCSCRW